MPDFFNLRSGNADINLFRGVHKVLTSVNNKQIKILANCFIKSYLNLKDLETEDKTVQNSSQARGNVAGTS